MSLDWVLCYILELPPALLKDPNPNPCDIYYFSSNYSKSRRPTGNFTPKHSPGFSFLTSLPVGTSKYTFLYHYHYCHSQFACSPSSIYHQTTLPNPWRFITLYLPACFLLLAAFTFDLSLKRIPLHHGERSHSVFISIKRDFGKHFLLPSAARIPCWFQRELCQCWWGWSLPLLAVALKFSRTIMKIQRAELLSFLKTRQRFVFFFFFFQFLSLDLCFRNPPLGGRSGLFISRWNRNWEAGVQQLLFFKHRL